MKIKLSCKKCNNEYEVDHWRKDKSYYCSKKCSDESKKGENNVKCTCCEKEFHMKQFQLKKYFRTRGIYCSKICQNKDLKIKMKGILNHQFGLKGNLNSSFKGLEIKRKNNNLIDIKVYVPNHPFCDKYGRVLKHRLIVEENYNLFDISNFIQIKNNFYLHIDLDIHHKDENHNNNNVDNLEILTRSEHTQLHNKQKQIIRDIKGKIIGVFKSDKLLENPEEDNQQPTTNLNG